MNARTQPSIKGRAFTLALVLGLSLSGLGAVASGAASGPRQPDPCPAGSFFTITPSGTQTPTATPCPSPEPTSAAPTTTVTVTATTSEDPTGTATPGATTTSTITTTATSTATTTTSTSETATITATTTATSTTTVVSTAGSTSTAGTYARVLTLEASRGKRTYGAPFTLTGGISSVEGSCVAGQTVEILRTVLGDHAAQPFDVLTSGTDGTFRGSYDADRGANYIAHLDGSPTCAEANSDTEPVLVRVKVSLRLSDNKVRRGQRIALRAKVAPCTGHTGTTVTLLKGVRGRLTKVATGRLSGSCKARWTQKVKKPTTFEVRWTAQHPDHLSGRSRRKPVRVI